MEIFPNLYNRLYEETLSDSTLEIAKGLAKIAELYWEKLPLEKRKRIVFKNYKNVLVLEYLPKTSFELMEYSKKDYSGLKKRIEISLKKEAESILQEFRRAGNYSRFMVYVEKGLLSPEEILLKIGFGEKVNQMLKSSIDYLLAKKEKTERKSEKKELIRLVPLLILISLLFFFSGSTTGLVSLPYAEISPLIFLFSLAIFLLFFLFFF
ncbi:MAG: hypothetical protein QXQ77_00405 [Candidatus Aenigmatarchaeota archaeon]